MDVMIIAKSMVPLLCLFLQRTGGIHVQNTEYPLLYPNFIDSVFRWFGGPTPKHSESVHIRKMMGCSGVIVR